MEEQKENDVLITCAFRENLNNSKQKDKLHFRS